MPNRLAAESSPYLRQHQDNPVEWLAWGEQALALARERRQPLLVSIGYSACHWCHVMAHESFEDAEVAELMNRRFVCVKVDREEHPDVDAACMEACQAITGRGGWPLNAFLTPEGHPFYAGTYFPPEQRHGMPSWRMVLLAVSDAWEKRPEQVRDQGVELARAIGASARLEPVADPIDPGTLPGAVESLRANYDSLNGGFGGAPKFPPASTVEFLLARGEREMSLQTLRSMAAGGMYDQLGGGFHRYSVDATWTVPHFEKMLYDNALLALAYLHGWQVCGEARMLEVCCETLDWVLREMRGPEGGFCAALDADSEGVEGKFYVWSLEELGEIAPEAIDYFGPRPAEHGGYVLEGRGEPPEALPEIRRRLLERRAGRVRPSLDDKRLTSWNGLMISALAEAGAVLEREDYLEAAVSCAEFLLLQRRTPDGMWLRTDRIAGFLDDHAYMLEALIALYEATFDSRWYREASSVAEAMITRFFDPERGGFFTTASDQRALVARRKDLEDTPIPSGNSSAALGLMRLALLSGESRYEERALGVLRLLYPLAVRHPQAFSHLLRAADLWSSPSREVAIAGSGAQAQALSRVVRSRLRPHLVLAGGEPDGVPLLAGRSEIDGRAAAYVCERFACQAPVTEAGALAALLGD